MKRSKTKIAVIAIASVAVLGTAWAASKHGDDHGRYEHRIEHMLEKMQRKLDLSEEQSVQVRALADETMQQMREMRETGRADVKALIQQDTLDAAQVLAAMDARKESRQQMREYAAERIVALHGILTPEQRVKAAEYADRLPMFGRGGRGHHGRHHSWW